MAVPAGWFPDPAGVADLHRWWDGGAWTRWLTTDAGSPAPTNPPTALASPAVRTDEPTRSIRAPWAVALVIAVVLVALVGVGATVAMTSDRIRTGPAVAPPPADPPPTLAYRPATRAVTVEELRMVLPGAPYECLNSPEKLPPFASVMSCDVLIHRNYNGSDDWYATAGVGLLPESLVVQGDLEQTGEKLFLSLRQRFFAGQATKLQKFVAQRTDISTPGKSMMLSGEVTYQIKGLSSTYDRMFLAIVQLRSGRHAAVYSVRPNDVPASTLAALDTSLGTLSTR